LKKGELIRGVFFRKGELVGRLKEKCQNIFHSTEGKNRRERW